jgi:acetyl esterase/lipase
MIEHALSRAPFGVLTLTLTMSTSPVPAQAMPQAEAFGVEIETPEHGSVSVDPPIPADGKVAAGTVLTVTATPDAGYALDSGFYVVPGRFGRMYHESPTTTFDVVIDRDKAISASFIEKEALEGFSVVQDVVYAKPGGKALKYDVYTPEGADALPIVVIVHGGGWRANDEDIMRGLARFLVRTGDYVVASVDYRWLGDGDGDDVPNTMANLVEDVYGAIAHIQEHAREYGGDASRIAVTGDSAGGHLSAAAANMADMIGDGGFGAEPGVYQYRPTYLPPGKTVAEVRSEISHAIQAAAPSYGVFGVEALGNANQRLGGTPLTEEAVRALAPIAQIPPGDRAVPQFLLRGTEDPLIPYEEVKAYADALEAAGQKAEHLEVEGASHAFLDWKPDAQTRATFEKYGVPNAGKMKAFFDTVFYPDRD